MSIKKQNLKNQKKTKEEQENELEAYKQKEIFEKIIIEEQTELSNLKAENLPPKEKNLWQKGLKLYIDQPRYIKIILSAIISVAVFTTPGTIVAAGGYLSTRLARSAVGAVASQTAIKGYDWAIKERYSGRKEEALSKLNEDFKNRTADGDIAEYRKRYAKILENEAKSERNRLVHKALVGFLAGGATALEAGHLIHGISVEHLSTNGAGTNMPNDLHHLPGTNKPNIDEHLFKTEKVDFSSKGAIQTLDDLKAKIHADYPDITKAPHSVQEFMKGNSVQQAIKLGFFNPNNASGAESAMLLKGSSLEFDQHGNLLVHDIKTGDTHTLIQENGATETVDKYHGKMFDSDKSAEIKTPNETTGNHNFENQEIKGQVNPETGESYTPNGENHFSTEQINPKNGGTYFNSDETTGDLHQNIPENNNELLQNDPFFQEKPIVSTDPNEYTQTVNPTEVFNPYHLTGEELLQVKELHQSNLEHLFADQKGMQSWMGIKDSTGSYSADKLLERPLDQTKESLQPIFKYMHQIEEVTGIKPLPETIFDQAESPAEYILRGEMKAIQMGKIDDLRL